MEDLIGECAEAIPPVPENTLCSDLYRLFSVDPDLLAIPVTRNDQPVGMVYRHDFFLRLADQYGRALYESKPVTALMDPEPLVVDGGNTSASVSRYVAQERPSALLKGLIIIDGGQYVGVVSGISLIQFSVERLERQARELEMARIAEEKANRAKSEFLATMSHELRTPLNAIIGFASLIGDEAFGPVQPTRYRDYAKDIHSSGTHLLGLINEILDMSKVEAGRLELHPSLMDVEEVIGSATRLVRPQAQAVGHELVIELDDGLPPIFADQRCLKQMLVNLLSNAVKFTPDGGRITVKAGLAPDGGFIISVEDNGIGIPQDRMEAVLKPFVQEDSAFNRKHNGTGLGLPLVKALAEAHGGIFRLESSLGSGTRGILLLPANATEDVRKKSA